MSDKNFKVKNGLTIQGTLDTLITPDNLGGILIGGSPLSSYSAPTLGTTSIASGSTITTISGLTDIVLNGPGSIADEFALIMMGAL